MLLRLIVDLQDSNVVLGRCMVPERLVVSAPHDLNIFGRASSKMVPEKQGSTVLYASHKHMFILFPHRICRKY